MDAEHYEFWKYFIIFIGEFSGTTFLLYFGCMGLTVKTTDGMAVLQAALVWGTVITSIVMIFGHTSRAHFNPSVTLCAFVLRLITPLTAIVYFLAQILGATWGLWLLTVTVPRSYFGNSTEGFCVTELHPEVTIYQGLFIEFLGTSFLIYAVCSAWDPRNAIWSDSVALKFGFVVIALVLCMAEYTSASLNPARSLGPAIIYNKWKNHWIYWVACLSGSLFTSLTYKYLYLPDAEDYLKSNDKLADQFRHGSLYSKQEDVDNLLPKTRH